jgi:hypothetical protein
MRNRPEDVQLQKRRWVLVSVSKVFNQTKSPLLEVDRGWGN